MEDNDFLDHIYQLWSKTTLAENGYWMPTEHELGTDRRFSIDAVESEDSSVRVAAGLSEADVDFITAVHGCFPDLIRRLRMAMDEAENLDLRVDDQEGVIAGLTQEVIDLQRALDEATS